MKKIFLFSFYLLAFDFLLFAQAPQGIPYQAIARNASGQAIASTSVKVRFSIRDSIATGAIKYQETHNPTTSALGLFSVNVGMGTVVNGTFYGINWGKNAKFLQVELDPAGSSSYTDLGTTQMMSVPYALYAGNVGSIPSGGSEGQTLTICGGTPTWTTAGNCPGTIVSLNCSLITSSGVLTKGLLANGVTCTIPYYGGNGGPYQSFSVASTGISGLIGRIDQGAYSIGSGVLTLNISGVPDSAGVAYFNFSISGRNCLIPVIVRSTLPVTDFDGNVYPTIGLGSQLWMAENLKVKKYRNGEALLGWANIGAAQMWGSFSVDNSNRYYYNWFAVDDFRGICPTGWHVPTGSDWSILESYLGGASLAGGNLKAVSSLWVSPNISGSDNYNFSGMPFGYLNQYGGGPYEFGTGAYWWTKDIAPSYQGKGIWVKNNSSILVRGEFPSWAGMPVRCLKD